MARLSPQKRNKAGSASIYTFPDILTDHGFSFLNRLSVMACVHCSIIFHSVKFIENAVIVMSFAQNVPVGIFPRKLEVSVLFPRSYRLATPGAERVRRPE